MRENKELTIDEKLALDRLYTYIDQSLVEGKDKGKIIKELMKNDWAEDVAAEMVNTRKEVIEEYKMTPQGKIEMANAYKRLMVKGFLWFAGGAMVTGITYALAEGGGWYFIFFGAIIFGFIDFVRGFIGWLNHR